jgi:hypothetical protein
MSIATYLQLTTVRISQRELSSLTALTGTYFEVRKQESSQCQKPLDIHRKVPQWKGRSRSDCSQRYKCIRKNVHFNFRRTELSSIIPQDYVNAASFSYITSFNATLFKRAGCNHVTLLRNLWRTSSITLIGHGFLLTASTM